MSAHLPIFSGQNPVFIPGPTNIPDRLRYAMSIQTTDHRAPDFVELLGPLLKDLKKVFKMEQGQVITWPCSILKTFFRSSSSGPRSSTKSGARWSVVWMLMA